MGYQERTSQQLSRDSKHFEYVDIHPRNHRGEKIRWDKPWSWKKRQDFLLDNYRYVVVRPLQIPPTYRLETIVEWQRRRGTMAMVRTSKEILQSSADDMRGKCVIATYSNGVDTMATTYGTGKGVNKDWCEFQMRIRQG